MMTVLERKERVSITLIDKPDTIPLIFTYKYLSIEVYHPQYFCIFR